MCTSGMKSSSSLGKVTGTLSLVRAQAPTLRIFIETYRDRLITILCLVFFRFIYRVSSLGVPVLLLFLELVVQVLADFDVLEHSGELVDEVCRHTNLTRAQFIPLYIV